jgi:serine/threonine-protein kinase
MAPEQFSGEELDGRVDVYALGVILYEMLAGRPPFDGTFSEVVGKHLYAEPPSFESLGVELPEGVEVVVRRALAKKPLERTSSVNELARSLARCFGVETAAGTSVMAPASLTAREGLPEIDFSPGPMLEPEEYATKVADRDDAETVVRPSARPPTAPVAVPPTAPVAVPPARSRAVAIAVPIVLGALALLVVAVVAAVVAVRYVNRAPALGETPARSGAAPVPAAPPDRTAPEPEPEADDAHIEGIPFYDEGEMVIYADTIDIEDGATLEITNAGTGRPERFALEPNDDRTRWVVRRTTLSEPGGKTVAELVPVGKLVETVIRNPSGTATKPVVISRPNE